MDHRREEVVEALPLSIVRARERVMGSFRSVLTKYDLTEPQWRVIWTVCSLGEVEMSELSRVTALLFPSLSRIVADLEKRGYVNRQSDPRDMRRMLVSLSDRGLALHDWVTPECRAVYRSIKKALGTEKLIQLQNLLVELDEKLSGIELDLPAPGVLPAELKPASPVKARGRPRKGG
ncbi:MAG: homoprotocatechuate degradation operon regulator HpaR [Pseudooceanicola sp.]|nr:homoprotocatechuate degradation operon regulator HpaR [Pseudooceanicola sp.]